MDYDDKDYQNQNRHLAGEGNSNFSPVLRPYALPKVDFDDSLHAHLRFDSLVENEVFLGIPSQEDNQWIEDFSRASSGIGFSSVTTETCSILRRKNVWSEATSSESVEMLLKSVGQEEMVLDETIADESDAVDELGILTKQMEPNLKQDDSLKDVIDSQHALPPDEFANPNSASEKDDSFVTRENLGMDKKFDEASPTKLDSSVTKCMNYKTQEDSQASDIGTSSGNVVASSVELCKQEIPSQVSDTTLEKKKNAVEDTDKRLEDGCVAVKAVNTDVQILRGTAVGSCTYNLDSPLCSDSKVECGEEHLGETSMTNLEEPSTLLPRGSDGLQTAEECNDDVCSTDPADGGNCEAIVLSEDTEINQQLNSKVHGESLGELQVDGGVEGHVIEVNNTKPGKFSFTELKMGSPAQIMQGQSSSMLSEVENEHSRQDNESSSSHLVDLSSFTEMHSSNELLMGKSGAENLKGGDDASGAHQAEQKPENVFSPVLAGSIQMCKEDTLSGQDDVGKYDVPSHEMRNAKLSTETSEGQCEIVKSIEIEKTVKSSLANESSKENMLYADGSILDHTMGIGPALEDTCLDGHDIMNGAPVHCGVGEKADEVFCHKEELKSPPLFVGPTGQEKKEEIEVKVPNEGSLSILKERSQAASDLGSVSEGPLLKNGKDSSADCVAPLLIETVNHSVSVEETCNAEIHSEQAVVGKNANQECSVDLEAYTLHDGPNIKQGAGPEAVALEKHNEIMEKINEAAPLKVADEASADQTFCDASSYDIDPNRMNEGGRSSIDSDKPSFDLSAGISSNGFSQTEKVKQEGLKGAVAENVSLSVVSDKAQANSLNLKENDGSREEKIFNLEVSAVTHLSEREPGKTVQGSHLTSGACPVDPKMVQELPPASPLASDGGILSGSAKHISERKTRRSSGKASSKENSRKRNNGSETSLRRESEKENKQYIVSMNPSRTGQLVQVKELESYGNVEGSGIRSSSATSIPTSNLPDLNTLSPSPALFQQPFTDLQQMQLRAQILVYGSLIQGTAPDETSMIPAFGSSDSGRSLWEPAWRVCVERLHGQRSRGNKLETPVQSRSGARVPDQMTKQSSLQDKALSSSVGRARNKGTPLPVVNAMIPVPSPLWNTSTPSSDNLQSSGMPRGMLYDYNQAFSPPNPIQTPPIRNLALSQAPFPGPWVASPQTSAFDYSGRFSVLPFTETVKLTPVSSVPLSTGVKNVAPSPLNQSGNPSAHLGTSSPLIVNKVTVPPSQHSADPKTRKRKKVSVPENHGQISLLAQTPSESMYIPLVGGHLSSKVPFCEGIGQISLFSQTQMESVCAPLVTGHFSTAVAVTAPSCFASKSSSDKVLTSVSPTSSTVHPKSGDRNVKKVTISEDTFNKVEEAKLQAEEAAAQAVAAVNQCEGVWRQLDTQRNSGLASDVEAKLASAAAAIAAAAAVAKAAAAAAKIASNAAAQAKVMVDEALVQTGTGNGTPSDPLSHPNVVNNLAKATPVSILKAGDGILSSSSIIVAAREAAKRRVEAASNASRHAENLDAIVKAAELAAAAVSQAGTIVTMGNPIQLRDLVEAGPEGYWRVPEVSLEQGVTLNNVNRGHAKVNRVDESPDVSARKSPEALMNQEMKTTKYGMPSRPRDVSRDLMEDHVRVAGGILGSVNGSEKDSKAKIGHRVSDLANTLGVVPESDSGLGSTSVGVQDDLENAAGTLKDSSIKEGCLVEVYKDGDVKAAWFPANVLSVRDGKAFVCYNKLMLDQGLGHPNEWVSLEDEADKSPRIRIPHPMTSVRVEGTGKRRRAAIRDYTWSVGDRADVLMQDCWREGVITGTDKKDTTTITVHFPAEGETSGVRLWQLRPTLIWKGRKWIEWSSSRGDCSLQGDTPQVKRRKLGTPVLEGKAKEKILKNIETVEPREHEEPRLLPLAANEKIFNVGENTGDENKLGAARTMRSGLQKEGSRVIFGVPKPGKKRKFMEVSKHYVADRSNKDNLGDGPVKLANYLMPHGQGSRGGRNNSKIDAKDKQVTESRQKVLKSGKSQSAFGRTIRRKDNDLSTQVSAPSDTTIADALDKHAIGNEENESGQQSLREFGSFPNTEVATKGPNAFSSRALQLDAPSNKVSTSKANIERQKKGKLAPAGGWWGKVEDKNKSVPEVAEPRRSNRRIQPTSRLLEGLQSSLTIPKMPAGSHDRSHKGQNTKGSNHS